MRFFKLSYAITGLCLLLGFLLLSQPVAGQSDSVGVQSADIQAELTSEGELQVKETIQYNFGNQQVTGFARRLQIPDGGDITIDSVQRDDLPENYRSTRAGSIRRVTTGNSDITLTGKHSYQFNYTVSGVVKSSQGNPYVIWQVISGSQVTAENITISLTAPFQISQATCRVQEIDLGCPVEKVEQGVQAQLTELPANRSVILSAQLPSDTLPQQAIIETDGKARIFFALILGLLVISGVSYWAYHYLESWVKQSRNEDDPTPEHIDSLTS